jgi:FkbM family methyltransferase
MSKKLNLRHASVNSALTLSQARKQTQRAPSSPDAWLALGRILTEQKEWANAREALEQAHSIRPENAEQLAFLGHVAYRQNRIQDASHYLHEALSRNSKIVLGLVTLAKLHIDRSEFQRGLEYAQKAHETSPQHISCIDTLASALSNLFRYEEAFDLYSRLTEMSPQDFSSWNNAGNMLRDLGRLNESYAYYKQASKLAHHPTPYSNHLTALHYDPKVSREEIMAFAKSWEERFAPPSHLVPPRPERPSAAPAKQLRLGLLSDGFRSHPVGKMITRCLESLPMGQFELYCYTTSDAIDVVTKRIQHCAHRWQPIRHLSDEEFAEQVRDDEIDILIDLSGHNTGSRMRAIAMQPAPLIVKWVGGLINTTGVQVIDYLISDHVETPEGEDEYYTEKLIRLPDDYIVFDPPEKLPALNELPAKTNGFITLACFNNPTKLNDVTLKQWASIMHELPGSRLMLKGRPYTSESFCERLYATLEAEGVARERLIIEGPGSNYEMLDAYNRADISLDPWPYSGGLTTCESFIMGVPVVTLTGPTFAGRHSATHLTHAGMPELVTHSWEEYHARVLELASDLESLSTIRRSLRQVLLQSPVCDGLRFAKHFTQAMRAIWQRYCEEKAPEALTFNADGELWFEDDKKPLNIQVTEKLASTAGFQWEIKGKLVALDNSAKLIKASAAEKLAKTKAFALLAFDAASDIQNPEAYAGHEHIQLFQQTSLGDGQPAKLNACLEPALSSSLTPLPDNQLPERHRKGAKVLAQLPISTIALDSINGLASLDWLILDELSDAASILEHGKNALKDTLLIQVGVAFQPTHERQPSLAELQHWASRNGFRFYRFNNEQHASYLPETVPEEKRQATELQSADVLFLPSHERMAELNNNQRTKLAFLLHTVYGIKDMAYELLKDVDEEKAAEYLVIADAFKLSQNRDKSSAKPKPAKVETETETVSSDIDSLLDGTEAPSSVFETPEQPPAASQTVASKSHESKARNLWELDDPIHVVDIGANPIDGTPPYAELLKRGFVKLVGFEPQKDALQKLLAMKGPNETYLPHAVGAGEKTQLYICQASGMTSTLKPNNKVLDHFQGYPIWGKVKSVEEIDTVRLDDVAEIGKVDWLKIDIQGGELNVFKNGEEKLKDTLVIQTEVNFIQLYENQPLFAEVDQWMRAHGFMLHTLLEQRKRLYAPMKINGGIHQGINQLTTADAVYVRDINLSQFTTAQRKKIAFILSKAYGSHDFAYRLLMNEKSFNKKDFFKKIVGKQINAISVD